MTSIYIELKFKYLINMAYNIRKVNLIINQN